MNRKARTLGWTIREQVMRQAGVHASASASIGQGR